MASRYVFPRQYIAVAPDKLGYSTWRRGLRLLSAASSIEVCAVIILNKGPLFLQCVPEHLGMIQPQNFVDGREQRVDSFMRAAPFPNADETRLRDDARVTDPLSDELLNLWEGTAKRNRDIFTEVFRPVPSDLVQNWDAYKVIVLEIAVYLLVCLSFGLLTTTVCVQRYVPNVKAGHVAPEINLDRVKKQLSQVRKLVCITICLTKLALDPWSAR